MMAARSGRIVEEVTIDEPYPPSADFRVSTAFSHCARRLQDSLFRVSGEVGGEARGEPGSDGAPLQRAA